MPGFMRVFVMVFVALTAGCLSWSRQTYEAQDDGPPRVRHSSWQAGILPGRSPVEAAQADAIGTGVKYGYGGGYYGGYGVAPMGLFGGGAQLQYSSSRPFGAPRSRVIRIENLDDEMWVRTRVNSVVVPGYLSPRAESFVVSNHPTDHRVEFCAYEAPGGAPLGYWGKSWRTREGLGQELVRGLFTGSACPF